MTNIIHDLQQHPILGFIFSVLFYAIGLLFNIVDSGFPLWFMQCVQLLAWFIAIAVGMITIVEWVKKYRKNGNKSKKD
jgi:predicted permease